MVFIHVYNKGQRQKRSSRTQVYIVILYDMNGGQTLNTRKCYNILYYIIINGLLNVINDNTNAFYFLNVLYAFLLVRGVDILEGNPSIP